MMPDDNSRLTCTDCLALASDHVDGVLRPVDAIRVEVHASQCSACARYLRVMIRGLELAREIPDIQPSPDRRWRLDRHLREIDEAMTARQQSVRSGATLAIAVAAVVALLAWSPILTPTDPALTTTMVGGQPAASATAADDADGWEWWYNGVEPVAMRPPNANNAFPGPYSPLLVEPPLGGDSRARTVLTSLIYSE